ncbi:STAS domain-containing protein [Streptomyces sp. IBSBF 2435]|uniref:STAS domain-containing protein n=1 Tax=Streptomyces sp. IBSBF 2435 TaxID=2903531 RepID=UPI002FDC6668
MDHPGGTIDNELTVIHARFHTPDAYVLTLRGVADIGRDDVLETAFADAAASVYPLIVDLGALTFADEQLLGLLLTATRTRPVVLVGPLPPTVTRRLALTGTEDVFTIQPNLTRALAALPA